MSINIPPAFAIDCEDIPYVEWMPGVKLKLLASNTETACFVVRLKFVPGIQLVPHMHTGCVHAFTIKGKWSYLEYDGKDSTAGVYLHEPSGSTHTLKVADDNTEETDVLFIVEGAMIHFNEDGSVMAIGDAESHVREYKEKCIEQGIPLPDIILGGQSQQINLSKV